VLLELAEVVKGKDSPDALKYRKLYEALVPQFNAAFYNPTTHTYDLPVQTSYVLPLWLGIVPKGDGERSFHINLLNDVVVNQKSHLSTGILGTKYLLPALSEIGRTDLALKIVSQTTYPSWAYMWTQTVETPATTLWELWDAPSSGPGMNSRNHIMYGSVGEWMYQYLAGIRQTNDSVGFKKVSIRPPPSAVLLFSDLNGVNASVNWPMGRVSSAWTMSTDKTNFKLAATIPSQSTANITIPLLDYSAFTILEAGQPVWQNGKFVPGVPGVTNAYARPEHIIFTVKNGDYNFQIINGKPSQSVCASQNETEVMVLQCSDPNQIMSVIKFASYGNPTGVAGKCDSFTTGSCNAGSATYVVERECLYRSGCKIMVSDETFGDPCLGTNKLLRVVALCTDPRPIGRFPSVKAILAQ